MIRHTVLCLLVGGLAAGTALAAEAPEEREMLFRQLDQNQDGHVSLFEARDKHRVFHYYQRADKNEDGHIDRAEFSAFEVEVPDYETP